MQPGYYDVEADDEATSRLPQIGNLPTARAASFLRNGYSGDYRPSRSRETAHANVSPKAP